MTSEKKNPHDTPDESVKIVDRRHFDSDGNLRSEEEGAPEPEPTEVAGGDSSASPSPEEGGASSTGPIEEVTFETFVMSLSVNALVALGDIPNPAGQTAMEDLGVARQLIDIIGMLEKKTEGNRTPREDEVIKTNLRDLRMRYVEKSRSDVKTG